MLKIDIVEESIVESERFRVYSQNLDKTISISKLLTLPKAENKARTVIENGRRHGVNYNTEYKMLQYYK